MRVQPITIFLSRGINRMFMRRPFATTSNTSPSNTSLKTSPQTGSSALPDTPQLDKTPNLDLTAGRNVLKSAQAGIDQRRVLIEAVQSREQYMRVLKHIKGENIQLGAVTLAKAAMDSIQRLNLSRDLSAYSALVLYSS